VVAEASVSPASRSGLPALADVHRLRRRSRDSAAPWRDRVRPVAARDHEAV